MKEGCESEEEEFVQEPGHTVSKESSLDRRPVFPAYAEQINV